MSWKKSTRCETSACVEVAFRRCDTGSCVEVSFTSACDNVSCVEVGQAPDAVLVRDSKRPDQQPISFTPDTWRRLLDRVKNGDEINWGGVFFPLDFTAEEISAFMSGAVAGEFDLPQRDGFQEAVRQGRVSQGPDGALIVDEQEVPDVG